MIRQRELGGGSSAGAAGISSAHGIGSGVVAQGGGFRSLNFRPGSIAFSITASSSLSRLGNVPPSAGEEIGAGFGFFSGAALVPAAFLRGARLGLILGLRFRLRLVGERRSRQGRPVFHWRADQRAERHLGKVHALLVGADHQPHRSLVGRRRTGAHPLHRVLEQLVQEDVVALVPGDGVKAQFLLGRPSMRTTAALGPGCPTGNRLSASCRRFFWPSEILLDDPLRW